MLVAWVTKVVNVMGSGLNAASQVQLTSGAAYPITSTNVTSNDGRVQATITVPRDAPAGSWDVVVADLQGHTSRLAQAIRIDGSSGGTSSELLDRYLNAGDLAPEIRQERMSNIQKAAQAEGMGDITVASFIREDSPDARQKQDQVARRLGLMS